MRNELDKMFQWHKTALIFAERKGNHIHNL